MTDKIDLTLLGKQMERTRAEVQRTRGELTDVCTLALQSSEFSRRLETRTSEMKDDLESIMKAEIMGRLANFETRIDGEFDALRADLPSIVAETPRAFTAEELEQLSARMKPQGNLQTPKSLPFAKMQLNGGNYEIIESDGVSSITDCGVGDVEISFIEAETDDAHSIPQLVSRDGSVRWKTVHHGPTSTRVKTLDDAGKPCDHPSLFKIWKS